MANDVLLHVHEGVQFVGYSLKIAKMSVKIYVMLILTTVVFKSCKFAISNHEMSYVNDQH